MAGKNTPPGPGIDSSGQAVQDPTGNVKDLVDAERRRTDDIRAIDKEHDKEIRALEREFAKNLRINEAGRLDAILTNVRDTALATATAAETRATTLADQATKSADALRSQVADTQQASTDALDRRFAPINTSIEEIRRWMFETQGGKQQVVETTAKSNNWAIWVGVLVAAVGLFVSSFLVTAGIVVTYLLSRP
jgi:hypothetical protein